MNRKHLSISLFFLLLLAPARAVAQLGGHEGAEAPQGALIATGEPHRVAERQKKVLLERQQALLAEAVELEADRNELAAVRAREGQARELLTRLRERAGRERDELRRWEERERQRQEALTALEVGEEDEEGGAEEWFGPRAPDPLRLALEKAEPRPGLSHPSYREQVEWLVQLLVRKAASLELLVSATLQQREVLAGAIQMADRILDRHGRTPGGRADEASAESFSLSAVRNLLYDLHLGRLELSLARSHERGLIGGGEADEALDPVMEEGLRAPPMADLPPDAERHMRETFEETLRVRDEAQELRQQIASLASRLRAREAALRDARRRALQLDVIAKQQRVDALSEQFEASLLRMRVTPEELAARRARHGTWEALIDAEIAQVEEAIATLRAAPEAVGVVGAELLSDGHLWSLRVSALEEERSDHLLRRERLHFTTESYEALASLLAGEEPDPAYLRRHERILDEEAFARRLEDIGRRREAWRRQHAQFLRSDGEEEGGRGRQDVLDVTQRLANTCSDQEAVLESNGRLAFIARHFLEDHAKAARGFWWFASRVLLTLLVLVLAGVASVFVGKVGLRLSRAVLEHARLPARLASGALDVRRVYRGTKRGLVFGLYLLGLLFVWVGALFVIVQLAWDVELGLGRLGTLLETPLFLVGETQVTPGSFLKLFVAVLLAVVGARLTQAFLRGQVFRFFEWDEGIRHAVSAVLRYVVLFVGVALGFEFVGIGLSTFTVLLGVVGIGIGFGLQHIANNFISGFLILFERPIKKGDFVSTGELDGEVLDIAARATTVRTRDNVSVIIPNSEFISGRVINWSHEDPRIRLRVPVGVAYGSDVAKVEAILLSVAQDNADVLTQPAPKVWFRSFGDSALEFELLVWTDDISGRHGLVSDLNKAIDAGFRAAGVEIPFPQRDVHIKSRAPGPDSDG